MTIPVLGELGALSAGSLGLSALLSMVHNRSVLLHEERLRTIQALSEAFTSEMKDVHLARGERFPIARRAILFSIFYLIPISLLIVSLKGINIAIPYHYTSHFLFWSSSGYKFKEVHGFVFALESFSDLAAICVGFYFGLKFKL